MSRLRTGSLEGRDNNKIDFAANQTLQIDGRMDLGNGTYLQMPTWDNANRPASPSYPVLDIIQNSFRWRFILVQIQRVEN